MKGITLLVITILCFLVAYVTYGSIYCQLAEKNNFSGISTLRERHQLTILKME
jgi:uncharacterized membrane protein